MPTITPEQEAESRALLGRGDILGKQAETATGLAYNPSYSGVGGSGIFSSKQGEKTINLDVKPLVSEAKTAQEQARSASPTTTSSEPPDYGSFDDLLPEEQEQQRLEQERERRLQSLTSSVEDYNNALDKLSISYTDSATAQIQTLKQQQEQALKSQEDLNRFEEGVYQQAGIRSGQARYAPEMNASMIADVKSRGLAKLGKINAEYNSAISEVITALETKQYSLAASKAEKAAALKEKALNEINDQIDKIGKIAEDSRKRLTSQRMEQGVSALVGAGVTNPNEIFSSLTELGFDTTSKEVNDTIKNLTIDGMAEKLPQDLQTFNYLKKSGMLPPGITSLPENQQYFGFLNMMKLAEGGKLSNAASAFGGSGSGGGTLVGTGAKNEVEEQIIRTRLFSKLMNILNKGTLSETDRAIIDERISLFRAAGMDEQEIMDELSGFAVNVQSPYNQKFRDLVVSNTDSLDGQTQLMGKISMLLNSGNYQTAMQTLERTAMDNARKTDPDNYLGQATAETYVSKTQRIKKLLQEGGVVGFVPGNFQNILRQVKGPEAAKIKSELTALYAEFRRGLAGTAVTESEMRFLEPLLADIGDPKGNFLAKLNTFEQNTLDRHNSARKSVGLPEVDTLDLTNTTRRLSKYQGEYEYNPFRMSSMKAQSFTNDDGTFNIPGEEPTQSSLITPKRPFTKF